MSINTGGYMVDPNHVELFINKGIAGACGSAPKGELIHEKGKYCELKPSCTSLGMWHRNMQGSSTAGSVGNVITIGSIKTGKLSDKEYKLSTLRWDQAFNDSDIVYYRFVEQLEETEEEREMGEEKVGKIEGMGKFGKAEVSKMAHYFQSVEETMKPFRNFRTIEGDRSFWHIKQGGTVCLMAHVDTVKTPTIPRHYNGTIWAKGLDDRLGIYMAMRLYSERDDVDVIITDDEEIGMSTAEMLTKKDLAQYNSIIELDRAGNDFVHYGCADTDLINAYTVYAEEGIGAFSDIDYIEDYARQCGCINVGIGYENAHGDDSFVEIKDLAKSWKNINSFLDVYHNVKFAKADKTKYDYGYGYGHAGDYTSWGHVNEVVPYKKKDEYDYCDYCGHAFTHKEMVNMGDNLYCCEECFETMMRSTEGLVEEPVQEIADEDVHPLCSECALELMEYEVEEGLCEYCKAKIKTNEWAGHFHD